jgi:hypothetical protein
MTTPTAPGTPTHPGALTLTPASRTRATPARATRPIRTTSTTHATVPAPRTRH